MFIFPFLNLDLLLILHDIAYNNKKANQMPSNSLKLQNSHTMEYYATMNNTIMEQYFLTWKSACFTIKWKNKKVSQKKQNIDYGLIFVLKQ